MTLQDSARLIKAVDSVVSLEGPPAHGFLAHPEWHVRGLLKGLQ